MTLKQQIEQQIYDSQVEIASCQVKIEELEAEIVKLNLLLNNLGVLDEPEAEPVEAEQPAEHNCPPSTPNLVTKPATYLANNGPFK